MFRTSNILFPTSIAKAIYALISPEIKAFAAETGTYGIACDKIPDLPAVIDIGFTSTDGQKFNLTIPSTELSVGPFKSNPSICQTLINSFGNYAIIGGSVLKVSSAAEYLGTSIHIHAALLLRMGC